MLDEKPMTIVAQTRAILARAGDELGLRLVDKRNSKLMRTLYVVTLMRFWNPRFMTSYTTTIGRTMYIPKDPLSFGSEGIHDLALLNHELQHIKDSMTQGRVWWAVLYLSPQIFSLCALGGFWFRPALCFLFCLLPWPSPFRVWAESRGYAISLATYARAGFEVGALQYEGHRSKFTGWAYYRMAWRWTPVRENLERLTLQLIEPRSN
jgi:hypothetical protein